MNTQSSLLVPSAAMKSRWPWRAAAYTGAGAAGTACHYLLLVTWVSGFGLPAVPSSGGAALAGALVNYLLNYHVVFRSPRPHRETLPRFVLVAATGILLNIAVIAGLLRLFDLHYLLAQLAATGCVLGTGFLLNQSWTFKS